MKQGFLFIIFITLAIVTGEAFAGVVKGSLPAQGTAEIVRKDVYELCYDMKRGQELGYSYTSTKNLSFNIHYHVNDDTFYLADQKGTDHGSGNVVIPESTAVCLMWQNKAFGSPALLEYRAELVEPEIPE